MSTLACVKKESSPELRVSRGVMEKRVISAPTFVEEKAKRPKRFEWVAVVSHLGF
jgi:hypothetical protein